MAARFTVSLASRVVGTLLLLALALVAGGLYWLNSLDGLKWLSRQAVAASGGRLRLDDAQGAVFSRFTVARAVYRDATGEFTAREVALAWRPLSLLTRELRVVELSVDSLHIVMSDTDDKPPQLPASLRLPLDVSIEDARARRIEIARVGVIEDVHFRWRARAEAHELELINTTVADVRSAGKLRVATAAPFVLSGQVGLDGKVSPGPIKADLTLSGNLDALQLQGSAAMRGVSAKATAALRPFTERPLAQLNLNADALDSATLDSKLPRTQFDIAIQAHMPARGRFAGSVRATNALAGPLDTQRVPLTQAAFAFAGSGTQWSLSEIDVGVGSNGRVRGSGMIEGDTARLELQLARIATAELHRKLKPITMVGTTTLTGNADGQRVDAHVEGGGARLDVAARHAKQVVTVERGTLRANAARLDFTGHAALTGERAFALDARFADLDPARFVAVPPARLNGTVAAKGTLMPAWQAQVQLALNNSTLRGRPLSADAAFTTAAQQWFAGEAHARYAGNRLDVSGRFGKPDDKLQWSLDAANLKAIDAGLAGGVKGQGTFAGSIERPSVEFTLVARQFAAFGLAASTLDAQGALQAAADAPLRLSARAAGIRSGNMVLDELKVDAHGSRLRHDINAALRGAKFDVSLNGAGGLDDAWRWRGAVSALEARGRVPFKLTAPAQLSVGRDLVEIEGLRAAVLDGEVGPAFLRVSQGRISTRGTLSGITAKALFAVLPHAGVDPRDAVLGGRWDFAVHETVAGAADLRLEKGDLGVLTDPALTVGLRRLQLNVTAQDNRLDAVLDAQSKHMGTVSAQVRTQLARRGPAWVLAADAPLSGNLAFDMQSLAWLRAMLPQLDRVGGRAAARLTLAGTLGNPRLSGEASGDALHVRAIGPGVHLTDGTLRATLDGTRLNVSTFYVKAGAGSIEADGTADVSAGLRNFKLNARATRARLVSTPQMTVVLSGSASAGLSDLKLALNGKFTLDEGRYDLGLERKPALGDDVVVTGRKDIGVPGAKPLRVLLDVTLDLNNKFMVRGNGLDAMLGGTLRTVTRNDALHALGTIHTVRGQYYAFGQELNIDRGRLTFAGPLNNPGLDLRAGRKIKTVDVGVEVSGSLQRPVVKLASVPAMPDSERLGWLLLGRDPQSASAAELALLQAAALTLGDPNKKPLQRQIAEGLGVDQFGVSRGSGDAIGVLAIGKRISERLTVRLEQSLGGTAGGLLKIDYLLSQRWRLEGTAGAENAGDILFTLRFD